MNMDENYFIKKNRYNSKWSVLQSKTMSLTGSTCLVADLTKEEAEDIVLKLENGSESTECPSCRVAVVYEHKEPSGCPYCHRSWVD